MDMRAHGLKRRSILFIVNETAHYVELKKLVQNVIGDDSAGVKFLFDRDGYNSPQLFKKEIVDSRANGFNPILLRQANEFYGTRLGRLCDGICTFILRSRFFQRFASHESWARFFHQAGKFWDELVRIRLKLCEIEALYSQMQFDLIILAEENIFLSTFLYTRTAKGKIPIIVYPFTIPNPQELINASFSSWPINSFVGRVVRLLGGRWVFSDGDRIHILLHPGRWIILFAVGGLPKSPWILNSEDSEYVLIESRRMMQLYSRLGFPERKLKLTGSINDDILFSGNSKEKIGIKERPLILVSLPPDQFPVSGAEFESYSEMLKSVLELYLPYKERFRFVFCKHPRLELEVEGLVNIHFEVASDSVIHLLPQAHLYIATVSATIRWAIASGVPVINYDFFRYRYDDYKGIDGVVHVFDRHTLESVLTELLLNSENYSKLKSSQVAESPFWGELDGQSGSRLSEVILGC